jgi:hypothetical protein
MLLLFFSGIAALRVLCAFVVSKSETLQAAGIFIKQTI